ncbi:MAG TPA: cupredoxin domain-containing protein [Acetobacteraceae bacterium]|nr:cupredoxin domain-containing protein [Acetobacteraceae bacterium]
MRIITVLLALAMAAPALAWAQPSATPPAVTVRLSSFSFDPAHLHVRVGIPVHLELKNVSNGRHNFSAPAFFAASRFLPGSATPADGAIEVGANQSVMVALVPRFPGKYPLLCTHFLHSLFGMSGTIEVTP